jgi:hypothetical protein
MLALAIGLWAAAPTDAGAQFALRSKIEGTLTDSTGAVLPGDTVTLTETTRNQVQTATTAATASTASRTSLPAPTPWSPT